MNNISYPNGWQQPKENIFEEIKWHPVYKSGEPKTKNVYLVTVHSVGIEPYVTVADWNGEKWSCELFGDVIAWSNYPKPFNKI